MLNSLLTKLICEIVDVTLSHNHLKSEEIVKIILEKSLGVFNADEEEENKTSTPTTAKSATVLNSATTPTANIQVSFPSVSAPSAADLISPVQKPISHQECGLGDIKNTKFSPPLPSLLLDEPADEAEDEEVEEEATPPPQPQPQQQKKPPRALKPVEDPPSVEEVVKLLNNKERITFCIRLLSRGQRNGKICGEKASVGQEFFDNKDGITIEKRVSSIACKKCSALQQKNPLMKYFPNATFSSSSEPAASKTTTQKQSKLDTTSKTKEKSTTAKKSAGSHDVDTESVQSGLPEDLSGLPVFEEEQTTAEEEVSGEGAAATITDDSEEIKPLGLEIFTIITNGSESKVKKNYYITKSKLSKDDYRVVLVKGKETDEFKFLMIGRVVKKDFDEFISRSGVLSSLSDFKEILSEISTEEEVLDFLLDNKIVHYQYQEEGDIARFEENEE